MSTIRFNAGAAHPRVTSSVRPAMLAGTTNNADSPLFLRRREAGVVELYDESTR